MEKGGDSVYGKYLVTGGTGFLGRAVVSALAGRGGKVRALVLKDDPLARELPEGVERAVGDVCEEASLRAFFSDAGEDACVVHCAGIVSVASRPGERLYAVNVEGTRSVLRLCRLQGVGRLVYVSSVHAIAEKPMGEEMTEPQKLFPGLVRGDYGRSKAMATELVCDAAAKGLNASVVFPSGIIGPGDTKPGSITSMLLSFLAGKLPVAVKGGYDFVDVRDVAEGIAACCERGQAGRGYILSGNYATIRDILEIVGEAANLRRRVIYLPTGVARLIAPICEWHDLRRKKPLYFTPYAVDVLRSNARFSHRAAGAALGYSPRPLRFTLWDTVRWLQGGASPAIGRKPRLRAGVRSLPSQ